MISRKFGVQAEYRIVAVDRAYRRIVLWGSTVAAGCHCHAMSLRQIAHYGGRKLFPPLFLGRAHPDFQTALEGSPGDNRNLRQQ